MKLKLLNVKKKAYDFDCIVDPVALHGLAMNVPDSTLLPLDATSRRVLITFHFHLSEAVAFKRI